MITWKKPNNSLKLTKCKNHKKLSVKSRKINSFQNNDRSQVLHVKCRSD